MKKITIFASILVGLTACATPEPIAPLTGPLVSQQVTETLLHKGLRGSRTRDPKLVERTYNFQCQTEFQGSLVSRVAAAKAVAIEHSGYVLPGQFALVATRRGITGYTNRRAQAATGCALVSAADAYKETDQVALLRFMTQPAVFAELQNKK